MDDGMNDELNAIVEAQDKAALDTYADVRGIKLDRRKSFANMMTDFEEAMTAPGAEPVDASLDDLMDGMTEEHLPDVPEPVAPSPHDIAALAHDADLSSQARAWAEGFADKIIRVDAAIDGSLMTVHLFTRHGDRRESVPVKGNTKSDIKAAFAALSVAFGVA
jgi:hypothetical protein